MRTFSVSLAAALLFSTRHAVAEVLTDEFTVNCAPLTVQMSDPIVNPGTAGTHVHAITGGTAFNRTMSNSRAVGAKATTCDKVLDNSNYWIPQLYHIRSDGKYELVTMQGNAAYYMNRVCDYAPGKKTCDKSIFPAAPPAGLRMTSGKPSLRTFNSSDIRQRAISHTCLMKDTSKETNGLPTQQCLRMRSQVTFPACWDGKRLDSDDHQSHMAFPAIGDYNGGVCPSTHPTAIIQVFFEFFYDTGAFSDTKFVYAMGDRTGYGLHGDFINGWTDQDRLYNALKTCTGSKGINDPNCSLNVDGKGGGASQQRNPEIPAVYEEEIGLNGPIAKLPGNNPVTKRSRLFAKAK